MRINHLRLKRTRYIFGARDYRWMLPGFGTIQSATGRAFIGGLLGYSQVYSTAGYIIDSYSKFDVSTNSPSPSNGFGGLAGFIENVHVKNSYAQGTLLCDDCEEVGGLIGKTYLSSVSNSHAIGPVTGATYSGGLVGYAGWQSAISNSYAAGSVIGTNYVGGLVGGTYSANVSNSYSTGTVFGTSEVGGLIGYFGGINYITDSYTKSFITSSTAYTGGLVGRNSSSTFYVGTNTWIDSGSNIAVNCWGGASNPSTGGNSANCSTI